MGRSDASEAMERLVSGLLRRAREQAAVHVEGGLHQLLRLLLGGAEGVELFGGEEFADLGFDGFLHFGVFLGVAVEGFIVEGSGGEMGGGGVVGVS